jgi:DNA-binding transcriptional regulator YhcF (GntR family)
MTKEEIKAFAQHIAKQYLESGRTENLSKLVARIAEEFSLNREFIKLLVAETNRAVFLRLFETSDDKTVEFPIAKFEEVMSYLEGGIEPQMYSPAVRDEEIDESLYDPSDLYVAPSSTRERMVQLDPLVEDMQNRKANTRIIILVQRAKQAAEEAQIEQAKIDQASEELEQLLKPFAEHGVSAEQLNALLKDTLGDDYTEDIDNLVQRIYAGMERGIESEFDKDNAVAQLASYLRQLKSGNKTAANSGNINEQIRAVLKEMLQYGVTLQEIHALLAQSLGPQYTPDVKQLIETEYRNLTMGMPMGQKIASYNSLKRAIGLVKKIERDSGYAIEKLAAEAASLDTEALARAIEISNNPEKVERVVKELLDYAEMKKLAEERKQLELLYDTVLMHTHTFKKIAAANAKQKELFTKIAENIGEALQTARTKEQKMYIERFITKLADEATGSSSSGGFWNKLNNFFNNLSTPLGVVNQSIGLAANIKNLQSIDLDLKAKRKQYEQAGLLGKSASMIEKRAAGAAIAGATKLLSAIKPIASKIVQGLSHPLGQMAINMGFQTANQIVQNKIEDKQDEIERLDRLGGQKMASMKTASVGPVEAFGMVKNVSFKTKRPYSDVLLMTAIANKNPHIKPELIKQVVNSLKLYAPAVLDDPFLTEEVVRRAHTYGGLDPNYLSSLTEFSSKATKHRQEQED